MKTSAADSLSTPLTSQMVGWTWACIESESSSLLSLTKVPLAASHLSFTLCLSYICAASVSHLCLAETTVFCVSLLLMFPYVHCSGHFTSH